MITSTSVTGENPFVYGEIVSAAAFADREEERERLGRDLASGQKVFLISPRRYGKSSLVRDVMRGLARQKILTVEVTVAASSSYVGFLESYAQALVAADTPAGRLKRWTSDLLGAIHPELRFDADPNSGRTKFTIGFPAVRSARDTARLAAEVFALPARIAQARKQRLAIALDEFQAITSFDGGAVENALRAAVQDQRQVGYVFSGSEPSLMERMLGPRRPFYKAGPVLRLDKINPDDFAVFIDERFRGSGIRPEDGLGEAIVDLAANVPYDVQRLAHETWDDVKESKKTAGLDDLHATLIRLLGEQHMVFEESWQRLTLPQRAVLRALVIEEGRELMSADVRARHRLPGTSTVQAALAALMRQDIITKDGGRYVTVDSLYREWVARKTY